MSSSPAPNAAPADSDPATPPRQAAANTGMPPGRPPKKRAFHPVRRGRRLFFFASFAVGAAAINSWLFADWLWRLEWSAWHTVLLILFFILSFAASFGCLHAIYGFFVLHFGDQGSITRLNDFEHQSMDDVSTAVVVPIYNEDVVRVYEGLRTMYESVRRTGYVERFDFFILSDSTDPGIWVQEETMWFEMARELGGFGRIHYRRRVSNKEKKSGNIRDFLNAWGQRYRYMIVLDADSVMQGATLVNLVKLMEANPNAGLIQTVPGLINNESLFGRLQQFSSRLFGPLFVAGLNYWVQDGGNYWGHNAIMRVDPFMHNCDLPMLPGRKPFGGHILSHDFVEAALLRREDWEVWLAWDLEGSWEEGPQGLIEFAQRDRRWCQGNLQHAMLLFAKGFRGISRVHLIMGILGYLASPLWLAFMLVFAWIKFYKKHVTGLSDIPVAPTTPLLKNFTMTEHGLLVFGISMGVIFLPKFIAILDLALSPARRKKFGGWCRATSSVVLETIVSALHAPILMIFHTTFVVTILLGKTVNWGPQKRVADGTAWSTALRSHWWHTLVGILWGVFVWFYIRDSFWWFVPVLVGLVLSIPVSVFFSRLGWGATARKLGLLMTPEEIAPPQEIIRLSERLALPVNKGLETPDADEKLTAVIVDPYVNAIHVSLLREKKLNPIYAKELEDLGAGSELIYDLREKLLHDGPTALSNAQRLSVMADSESMAWLHSRVWTLPVQQLSDWWPRAMKAYDV